MEKIAKMAKLKNLIDSAQPIGIAAKAAIISKFNKKKGADYLVGAMGAIPGIPAKLSQIMSTKLEGDYEAGDVSIIPLPLEFITTQFKEEAPILFEQVQHISEEGITASLGQVHKVTLEDGTQYAVKFQYPDLREQVKLQLDNFFKLAGISPAKKFGLDVDNYELKFREILNNELDYETEAKTQIEFSQMYRSNSAVVIPKIDRRYTTKSLLVQSWEESIHVKQFAKTASIEARVAASKNIVQMFFEGLFQHHHIHGDLHPMNWGIKETSNSLVMYDFGATETITKHHADTILQFIRSYSRNEPVRPFDYLVEIGFDPKKLQHIANKLPTLCQKIFEPFIENQFWQMAHWEMGEHFDKVLGSDKWWFRTAGPTWFFMLIKSLSGALEGVKTLDVNLNLYQLLEASTQGLETSVSVKNLEREFPGTELMSDACAKNLLIKVFEGDRKTVDLTMPCRSVDMLQDLIPEAAMTYIKSENIDVSKLVEKVQKSGYLPQTILETKGNKRFHIFLGSSA